MRYIGDEPDGAKFIGTEHYAGMIVIFAILALIGIRHTFER